MRTMRLAAGLAIMTVAAAAGETAREAFEERSVTVTEAGREVEFRYRLLRPAVVEPGATYPVVLFLHGSGERGSDNEQQLNHLPTWLAEPPLRRSHPCFVVAPQCRAGGCWSGYDAADKRAAPHAAAPTADLAAAMAAVDAVLEAEPADPRRVYLTGLSLGGYGSWDLAARMPDRFAAVVPICGGGDEATAGRLVGLPIWCFHGGADAVVPAARSRSMVEAVKAAGGSVQYTEYDGVGHDAWTPAYRDPATLDWLFRQRREP